MTEKTFYLGFSSVVFLPKGNHSRADGHVVVWVGRYSVRCWRCFCYDFLGCIFVFTAAASSSVSTYLLPDSSWSSSLLKIFIGSVENGGGKWRRSVVVIGAVYSKVLCSRRWSKQ